MKLIYKGKYESEKDLPVRNHPEGFVAFREAEDIRRLAILLNCISIPLLIAAIGGLVLRGRTFLMEQPLATSMGMIASFAILFPHELLHAICFKGASTAFNTICAPVFSSPLKVSAYFSLPSSTTLPYLHSTFAYVLYRLELQHDNWLH